MSTRYEVGGYLIDANGVRHEIELVYDDRVSILVKIEGEDVAVPHHHYLYEPPARVLSLQEATDAAKAGERVTHSGNTARWRSKGTDHFGLIFDEGNLRVDVSEEYLTGWRVVPKAEALPRMTERLKENLDSLDAAFTRYDSGRTPGTYDRDKEINLGIASRAVRDAYMRAKGAAK